MEDIDYIDEDIDCGVCGLPADECGCVAGQDPRFPNLLLVPGDADSGGMAKLYHRKV